MNIFLCCSKHFYHKLPPYIQELEHLGHTITVPNSYEHPFKEEEMKLQGKEGHIIWKSNMLRQQALKVQANDAVLVFNFEKNGQPNYIGGATFLEIFKAFELGKKIYLFNPIPDNIFKDELTAINPVVLYGELSHINLIISSSKSYSLSPSRQ